MHCCTLHCTATKQGYHGGGRAVALIAWQTGCSFQKTGKVFFSEFRPSSPFKPFQALMHDWLRNRGSRADPC